ncbi:MAG: sulfatase [Armatimonadota bacterium]|nr:MAG: sulfatase [Armatimonadota bacterium]
MLAASLVALGLLAVALDRHLRSPPPPLPRPTRFVLIVVDALRADHLGCYGHPGKLTPNMDALAARGVRFENLFSAAPETLQSNAALFTGCLPSYSCDRVKFRLWLDIPTFVEHLREAGFRTAAFSAQPRISPNFGFGRGFDLFLMWPLDDDSATGSCIRWLKRQTSGKSFALLYLLDPHSPYRPRRTSDASRVMLARPNVRPQIADGAIWDHAADLSIVEKPVTDGQYSRPELDALHSLYCDEIRDADERIGRVIAAVGANAVVFLIADHGEGWTYPGALTHSSSLHPDVTKVPFIIAGPQITPTVRRDLAGTCDVAPTVLALADATPLPKTRGRNVLGEHVARRSAIIAEKGPWCAVYTADRALVSTEETNTFIALSPNASRANDNGMVALAIAHKRTMRTNAQYVRPGRPILLQKATVEQLRSLGYVAE